jgi:hypothetical protein
MRTLKEFLEEEAEKLRTVPPKGVVMRDEWIAAVDRLMDQILGWIAEADPNHILTIEERTVTIREQMIGSYEVRALTLILGIWTVRVEPIARGVLGPLDRSLPYRKNRVFGQVNLTNGLQKYKIYRRTKDVDSKWFMTNEDGYDWQEFDRDAFEAAIQRLFD